MTLDNHISYDSHLCAPDPKSAPGEFQRKESTGAKGSGKKCCGQYKNAEEFKVNDESIQNRLQRQNLFLLQ